MEDGLDPALPRPGTGSRKSGTLKDEVHEADNNSLMLRSLEFTALEFSPHCAVRPA